MPELLSRISSSPKRFANRVNYLVYPTYREMLQIALTQLNDAHRSQAALQLRYDELKAEMRRFVAAQVSS